MNRTPLPAPRTPLPAPRTPLPASRTPLPARFAVAALLLCGLINAGPAAPARGEDAPSALRLLPEKTVVFVRSPNVRLLAEHWQETSVGRMAKDEQLRPLISHLYGSLLAAFAPIQEQAGVGLDGILKVPQGEFCFGLIPTPDAEGFQALAYLDCGDELPTVQKLLDRAIEEAISNNQRVREEQYNGVRLTVVGGDNAPCLFFRDKRVVLVTGESLAKQLIDVWDGKAEESTTLGDNLRFTSIMSRCDVRDDNQPDVMFFVDPLAIVDQATKGNFAAQAVLLLLKPLGIYGIQGAGGAIYFATEDFDAVTHLHLLLENPRKGALKVLAMKSGETEPEPWVPEDIISYTTLHWDVGESYDGIRGLVDTIRGQGTVDTFVQRRFSDRLGIDLQQDVLRQMAGRFSMVQWLEPPARLNSGAVLFGMELKDPAKMKATLETLAVKFPEALHLENYSGIGYYRIADGNGDERRRQRRERMAAEGRPLPNEPDPDLVRTPTPSVAIVADHLLFSDSLPLLKEAITTKRRGKSLRENLEFKLIEGKVRRQLSGVEPGLFSFNRPEEGFRAMYEMANSPSFRRTIKENAASNPALRTLDEALEANPLPPFSVLSKYFAPGGAMAIDDETGLHYISFGLRRETE